MKPNLKLKLPKLKAFNPLSLLRLLPLVTLAGLLACFAFTISFLYQYFYQTIAQVKVVSILRNQVALNQVNLPLYQKVLNAWEIKKQFDPSALEGLRDSFKPLPAAAPVDQPNLEEVNSVP
ncbi:MAG: hypothetical protein U1C53_02780 [Candidatus Veblenbacteria bacterium]|nr:hypothetical protein [Candidatus Veblenbacteria bacterium]MDZ4230039.1 hypothetical protein [Candidatus Veblenbacteria bacterium]